MECFIFILVHDEINAHVLLIVKISGTKVDCFKFIKYNPRRTDYLLTYMATFCTTYFFWRSTVDNSNTNCGNCFSS